MKYKRETSVRRLLKNGKVDDVIEEVKQDSKKIQVVLQALEDEDWYVRSNATTVLGSIGSVGPDIIPSLIRALEDKDDSVRTSAGCALAKFGPKAAEAVPNLIKTLGSRVELVRRGALYALEKIGPAAVEAVPALVKVLEGRDEYHRWLAAKALGNIGPGALKAVPALERAQRDWHKDVRKAAVEALRKINSSESSVKARKDVNNLIKALKDEKDFYIRENAAKKALEKIRENSEKPALKCKNCGFVNKEGSNFCENCGSKLSKEEQKEESHSRAKTHYDRGIQLCQEYMWKGGIGDGAYVAIHRAMEEFKVALKLNPNFQLARLALADCYFCCPNSFDLNPFDAAILYQEAIKSSPDLIIDKDQASLADRYMKQGPDRGYEAAIAYRKAMKREPVIWR